ncbi:MAG: hypothetical protein JST42_12035, partial [Bacteroidetes bacterium]|nr:hypothetical protein [Bacteroidota bacterium]
MSSINHLIIMVPFSLLLSGHPAVTPGPARGTAGPARPYRARTTWIVQ